MLLLCILLLSPAYAARHSVSNGWGWTMNAQVGVFQPTGSALKSFMGSCCNMTGGFSAGGLWKQRIGFEAGTDVLYSSGQALSTSTGAASADTYKLWMLPMQVSGVFHFQMRPHQLLVPYVKAGADLAYFHEDDVGTIIQGIKGGLHVNGGLMLWLNEIGDGDLAGDGDNYENVYLTLDGRYRWINNFGKGGLDLSGYTGTLGVHVQF